MSDAQPQPYGVGPAGGTPPGEYPYGQQPYAGYAPHLYGQPGYGPPGFGQRDPDARPGTVLAAGIVTIVTCGLVFLVALTGLMLDSALAALDSDLAGTRELLLNTLWLLWSVAGVVVAALALRRSNGARIALLVSSGLTVAACVIGLATSGLFGAAFPLLAAVAVIVLMLVGGATEWYRGRLD
jgi:hypothetical protein